MNGATSREGAVIVSRPHTAFDPSKPLDGESSRPGTAAWDIRPGSRLGTSGTARSRPATTATNTSRAQTAGGQAAGIVSDSAVKASRSGDNVDDDLTRKCPSQRYFHTYPHLHTGAKRSAPMYRELMYIRHHLAKEEIRLAG